MEAEGVRDAGEKIGYDFKAAAGLPDSMQKLASSVMVFMLTQIGTPQIFAA